MVKKVLLIVFGLIAFLLGLVITAAGAALLAVGGSSGTLRSGYHAIGTPTYGFVSDPKQVRSDQNQSLRSGEATLIVDARNSRRPVFIGVGPTDQVNRYLTGTTYDTVNKIDFGGNFDFETTRVPGTAQPAAPGDQTFWVAQATGTNPQLRWKIADGDYRVVVMNADASSNVNTDVRIGLRVPGLHGAALGLTIGGGLLTLLGLGLMIWGIAAKRSRPPEAGYPGYPGYPGYGQPVPASGYPATPPPGTQPGQPAPPYAPPTTSGQPGTPMPGTPPPPPPGTYPPGTGQPGTGQPGTGQPGTGQPGAGQPGPAQPGTAQPGQPGAAQPPMEPPGPDDSTTYPATYRRPPDDPTRPPS